MTGTLTRAMKRRLWEWFGTAEHPAEWDGIVYGGGKISQRFWEYFVATFIQTQWSSTSVEGRRRPA